MDIISQNITNNFRKIFAYYCSNNDNSKIIIISYYNIYLLLYDLKTSILEEVPNGNNYPLFSNIWSLNLKKCFNEKS